jgi:hypothetical protein
MFSRFALRMKLCRAIPVGLKCETRETCVYCGLEDSTRYVSVCEFLHIDNTGSSEKWPKTGILKSIVYHKIPTVEFDLAAISVTVCDGAAKFSVMVSGGGCSFLLLYSFQFVFHKREHWLQNFQQASGRSTYRWVPPSLISIIFTFVLFR